jgi:hypothetical protein
MAKSIILNKIEKGKAKEQKSYRQILTHIKNLKTHINNNVKIKIKPRKSANNSNCKHVKAKLKGNRKDQKNNFKKNSNPKMAFDSNSINKAKGNPNFTKSINYNIKQEKEQFQIHVLDKEEKDKVKYKKKALTPPENLELIQNLEKIDKVIIEILQIHKIHSFFFNKNYIRDCRYLYNYYAPKTMLGGEKYFPPFGSVKLGFNLDHLRCIDDKGEKKWVNCFASDNPWSIAYHGTDISQISQIINQGLLIGGGKIPISHGQLYGKGIYVSPFPEIALTYAKPFLVSGRAFRVLIQVKVLTKKKISFMSRCNEEGVWLIDDPNNIRLFSLCFYEFKPACNFK